MLSLHLTNHLLDFILNHLHNQLFLTRENILYLMQPKKKGAKNTLLKENLRNEKCRENRLPQPFKHLELSAPFNDKKGAYKYAPSL